MWNGFPQPQNRRCCLWTLCSFDKQNTMYKTKENKNRNDSESVCKQKIKKSGQKEPFYSALRLAARVCLSAQKLLKWPKWLQVIWWHISHWLARILESHQQQQQQRHHHHHHHEPNQRQVQVYIINIRMMFKVIVMTF